MRQTQWANGLRITAYVLPRQHSIHLRFTKDKLQMFPYQLDRIWNKLTYSGLGGLHPLQSIHQKNLSVR